jgi:hypothetical protein
MTRVTGLKEGRVRPLVVASCQVQRGQERGQEERADLLKVNRRGPRLGSGGRDGK